MRLNTTLFFILVLFISSACVKQEPDIIEKLVAQEGKGLLVFFVELRSITLEYGDQQGRLISNEKKSYDRETIEPFGNMMTTHPSGLKVLNIESGEQFIDNAWVRDQELRFKPIPFNVEEGKINILGKVIFDRVKVRRKYSGQTKVSWYHRISFADNTEEIKRVLEKQYGSIPLQIVNHRISSKPLLFNQGNRFYSRKYSGWLEKVDALIKSTSTSN